MRKNNEIIYFITFYGLCGTALFLPLSKAFSSVFFGIATAGFFTNMYLSGSLKNQWHTLLNTYRPLFLFLFFGILSLIWGCYFPVNFQGLSKYFRSFLLLIMIVNTIHDKKSMHKLLFFLLLGALLTSTNGIIQYYSGIDLLKGHLLARGRITSNFNTPTTFSAYLLLTLCLSFLFISSREILKHIFAFGTFIILGYALFLSFTRNTTFFLIVSGWFSLLIFFKFRFLQIAILSLTIMFLALFIKLPSSQRTLGSAIKNFTFSHDASTPMNERLFLWMIAFKMIQDRPILGHGLNGYSRINAKYFPKTKNKMPRFASYLYLAYPHNGYLKIWIEAGIIGLLLYLYIYVFLLKKILHRLYQTGIAHRWRISCYLIGILAFMMSSFFDTFMESTQTRITFWMVMGLVMTELKFALVDEVAKKTNVLRVPIVAPQT